MKERNSVLLRTKSHELLVMSKLCELYATLPPERRRQVHAHIGGMLDDLPTIAAAVQSAEELALPFHRDREAADGASEAAR